MKHLSYVFIFITLCCCTACGVTYPSLSIQRKPEIIFSDAATHILVINRYDVQKVDFILRKEKKKEVYSRGINAEIAQVLSELESMKGINLIKKSDSLTMARNLQANLDSTVLTIGEIRYLATKYKADYILALENYEASFVQDEVVRKKNSDGSTSKTASYSLAVESSWVLYDKMGKSFKELRGNASQFHSERSVLSGLLAVGPALGSNTKTVQEVSIAAGKRVAAYFQGQIVSFTRPLYSDKALAESANDMRNGNYILAEEKLETLTKSLDVAIASKAYYNLAVLADLKGDRQLATDLAALSQQKKKNIYASMLLNGFNN